MMHAPRTGSGLPLQSDLLPSLPASRRERSSGALRSLGLLAAALGALAACGGDEDSPATPDGPPPDTAPVGCDPLTVLPSNYRPIPKVSSGAVTVTTTSGVTSGTIDGTAGGTTMSADNPYIYVDLKTGTRVDVNDLDARTSAAWDIALKRSSLRVNSGDSGTGNRKLAVVQAQTLAEVTAAPTSGYAVDDFADASCKLVELLIGEPSSAFGQWYDYNDTTHVVSPKREVYVIERPDGSHTALRLITYYGDTASPMRGAYFQVEWKQL
jgi:hypothetical protein